MKRICTILFIAFFATIGRAQDIQLSQFYASPLFLNPALTGNIYKGRIGLVNRTQWNGVNTAYNSFVFSFDQNIPSKHSGIGLLVTRDGSGTGQLNTTTAHGSYAYSIDINRKYSFRFGAQAGYVQRTVDFSKLIFSDQINSGGPTVENTLAPNVQYLDFGAGGMLFSSNFYLGMAATHINSPRDAFLGDLTSRVQPKFSIQSGFTIPTVRSKKRVLQSFSGALLYKTQGKADQLDLGVYYKMRGLIFGTWYRGLAFTTDYRKPSANTDAFVFMAGIYTQTFKLGYSYDITLSDLYGNTQGSHEISLQLEYPFKRKGRKPKYKLVPCPEF